MQQTQPELKLHRRRRPFRRGVALLPSLFTVANLGMGWYSIQQACLALQLRDPSLGRQAGHLDAAAKAIGWAILLDGFDGRIARLTNSSSAFGREFDSLADVISFGVAPALLAYIWGIRFLLLPGSQYQPLDHAGQIVCFLFVIACAARLARFNIMSGDAKPSNPGRDERKYFVGMPTPAAAGMSAAVVHFFASRNFQFGQPNTNGLAAIAWLALMLLLSYFMVSTWRFFSFKDINLRRRRTWETVMLIALLFGAIWFFSELVLLGVAVTYTGSAILWRLTYYWRRSRRHPEAA